VVNVKVGRVGGLSAVQEINDLCVARGVPMWCGGMWRPASGAPTTSTFATMPGFVYPGDTASPAARTRGTSSSSPWSHGRMMHVPAGPHRVTLDRGFLAEVTVRRSPPAVTIEFVELRTAAQLAALPDLECAVGAASTRWCRSTCSCDDQRGRRAIGAFERRRARRGGVRLATREPDVHHFALPRRPTVASRAGLGAELKRRQRTWCLAHGIRRCVGRTTR